LKMLDINGDTVRVNVDPSQYPIRGKMSRSKIQYEVGEKLVDKFALYNILEEWPIPNSRLSIDFFIPQLGIVIEVDGQQHNKFSKFFHGTIDNFMKQKERDKRKEDWCSINNLTLVRIVEPNQVENI